MKAFRYISTVIAAVAAASMAACTVHSTEAPPLSGPSDLALSISVTSSPQTITQNGSDAAVVTAKLYFTDPKTGATTPKANVPVRFDMAVNGVGMDFGTLSARSAVTGADGTARTTYTAPPMPSGGSTGSGCNGVPGQCVQIVATTTDTTAANNGTATGAATIALVPQGVILPPAGTPTASFSISPTPVAQGSAATFDASASTPGSGASTITGYSWNFGDGTNGSGRTVSHTYNASGTFTVTLTVTNDRSLSASSTQSVSVGAVAGPSAKFVFSPTSPSAGQAVVFNGNTSTAAPGHSITTYSWNFGDGLTGTGIVVSHIFATTGVYNVTLSVTDDLGQTNVVSSGVTVSSGGGGGGISQTTASFSFSPLTPSAGQPIFFNAASSTAASGHTLTKYAWDFGDGTTFNGSVATATHSFTAAGSFSVTLTVTDDSGNTATVKTPITVSAASSGSLTAGFTASPSNPVSGSLVSFNANTSTPLASITQFDWDFGDGTVINNGGMIINHTYNTPVAATFVVRLTVHDSSGNTNTTTQSLSVGFGSDPIANFTISPNPVSLGASISVDGSASTAGAGAITTYQWNFGDSATIFTGNPQSHTYTATGTYTIKLTVTQTNGRTNSTTHTVVVQ